MYITFWKIASFIKIQEKTFKIQRYLSCTLLYVTLRDIPSLTTIQKNLWNPILVEWNFFVYMSPSGILHHWQQWKEKTRIPCCSWVLFIVYVTLRNIVTSFITMKEKILSSRFTWVVLYCICQLQAYYVKCNANIDNNARIATKN